MVEMTQALSEIYALDVLRSIAAQDDSSVGQQEVYAAMLAFAGACLERDMTQTTADTLAYLLQDPVVNTRIRDDAAEAFAELSSRICPRVILDAQAFADGMNLKSMLAYLLEVVSPDST